MGQTAFQKTKSSDTEIELIELSQQEVQLLRVIRTSLKFGEITVRVRNGIPYQLVRVQELVNLGE